MPENPYAHSIIIMCALYCRLACPPQTPVVIQFSARDATSSDES